MAVSLSPQVICDLYTLEQINEKVTFWEGQLERASTKLYDKDTTQGRQRVEASDLDKISDTLQVYLKAKQLKSGLGQPHIISANFRNRGF